MTLQEKAQTQSLEPRLHLHEVFGTVSLESCYLAPGVDDSCCSTHYRKHVESHLSLTAPSMYKTCHDALLHFGVDF